MPWGKPQFGTGVRTLAPSKVLLRVVAEEEGMSHLQKHENNKVKTDLQKVLQAIAEDRFDAPQSHGHQERSPTVLP